MGGTTVVAAISVTLVAAEPARRRHKVVVLGTHLPANDIRPAVELMVGMDAAGINNTLHSFRLALEGLILLAGLIVAALGYWIAVVGLRPVQQLSVDTQRIGRRQAGSSGRYREGVEHAHERLQLPVLPRELLTLGISINTALDRLSATYLQLETFNADVAHELRTPVTNLIGQTQVALSRERSVPELREILQSNLEELERLRGIVADMLFLARAEQGTRAYDAVQVSLAQEMGKIVDFFEMLLDDAGLEVQIRGDAQVVVQRHLLRRALNNLLQTPYSMAQARQSLT
jgi:two-component system heavy metal sensor histidine kinase CusS